MLKHGTDGAPLDSTPQLGHRFETSLLSVNRQPAQPFEVNFKANRDVVTMTFGLCIGQKAYDTDRRNRLYETPDVAYFHPAGSHVYVLAEQSSEVLCFSFDTLLRRQILSDIGVNDRDTTIETVENIASNHATALAPVLNALLSTGLADGSVQGESLAIGFFEAVLRRALHVGAHPRRPGMDSRRLRRVLDYIEVNLCQDISLSELCQVGSLQINHFSRAFKQATGVPTHQYIITRRVARAKDLLRSTDMPIAQISYLLNFSSQTHFTCVFKKHTRTTPLVYRAER